MSKKILIDSSSEEETRIALTDNGKLDDFEIEPIKKIAVKGDVYLAKITRVEASLQAAFVDYGANRHGFLPLTEIHPDYFKIPVSDQETLKKLTMEIKNDQEIDEIKRQPPEKSEICAKCPYNSGPIKLCGPLGSEIGLAENPSNNAN